MAITRTETQVTFAAANSKSVAAGGDDLSDIVTLADNAIAAAITLKADNSGTPATGDWIDFFWCASAGDPDADADSADEYASAGEWLARVDTNHAKAVSGAFVETVMLPTAPTRGKLRALSNAASNAIVVSAQIESQLAA